MPSDKSLSGTTLRRVMRHVPSPVVIVTASGAGKARGITIGSLASVSLEPPLLSFNVNRKAQIHEVLLATERFVVNVVTDNQIGLCRHFARPDLSGQEQFAGIPHHRAGEDGTPIIDGTAAVLRCRPHQRFEAGDHTVFVGEVVRAKVHDEEAGSVVYYHHGYRSVGTAAQSSAPLPVKRASNATS